MSDRDPVTIYLAGPIGHAENNGEDWRELIETEYADEAEFLNPLSKYNIPADELTVVDGTSDPDDETTVGVEEIVETDKDLLERADAVLVGYKPVRSIGTPMEVMWSYEREYPIALWPIDGAWKQNLSPWYRYHVDLVATQRSCVEFLVQTVKQERLSADPATRPAMATWSVDCSDCGASYAHEHRGEPDECVECSSESLDVQRMATDGGEHEEIEYCPICGESAETSFAWTEKGKARADIECPKHGEVSVKIGIKEALDERYGDYGHHIPAYAPSECDEECHICGEPFDSDEWDERHITGGASAGEDWKYTCPNCQNETVEVGT